MKSLNDNLSDEFAEILTTREIKEMISDRKLDANIIKRAFEK